LAEVAFLAQADQQHAVGERATHVVQQQRAAELSLHVAAADDLADVSPGGPIDQLGGQAWLAVVEYADDHAGAALLLGAAAFYGKFHCRSVVSSVDLSIAFKGRKRHYRQIGPKKSKFFRRHGLSP